MSLSGCARDLASGLASSVSGWIVFAGPTGQLQNYHWLGWIAVASGLFGLWLAHHVRVSEQEPSAAPTSPSQTAPALRPAAADPIGE